MLLRCVLVRPLIDSHACRLAVSIRFEPERVKQDVLASQRRRLFLHTTLTQGKHAPWDYEPRKDTSRQYVRSVGTTSTTATKAKARFPFVPTVPPDTPRNPGRS